MSIDDIDQPDDFILEHYRPFLPEGEIRANGTPLEIGNMVANGDLGTVYGVKRIGEAEVTGIVAKFIKPESPFVTSEGTADKWVQGEYDALLERRKEPEGTIYVEPKGLIQGDDGKPTGYLMEQITGVEWHKYAGPPLPKTRVQEFISKLQTLAQKGKPHGDLKPDNIYIQGEADNLRFIVTDPAPKGVNDLESLKRSDETQIQILQKVFPLPTV